MRHFYATIPRNLEPQLSAPVTYLARSESRIKPMSKNVKPYVKREAVPPSVDANNLPTDRPIAIYLRQSSKAQGGNVSTDMQRIDLPARIREKGWQESDTRTIPD